ncbi:MAG: hypothetical protein ABR557_03160 [Pyrinomonadaceae bacterium]
MPQRAQRVEESLAILVWWTLCPRSMHLAEAHPSGNMGVTMVGDRGFITLVSGMGLVAQGEFENNVARRNSNLRTAAIST